jgi:glycosyltransferase involved in cell wall biosynthesis
MRIGIDASNIRTGGGVTHLVELLGAAEPKRNSFDSIIVWASKATLARLQPHPWLIQRSDPVLEEHYLRRAFWQRGMGKLAKAERCDVLFVPGGTYVTDFRPIVTMNQNLLPFQWREAFRYGFSFLTIKWAALRFSQSASLKRADGSIFLTHYAQDEVLKVTGPLRGKTKIIPHGLNARFFVSPRPQRSISEYSQDSPFRVLYVSPIEPYKHQWHVAEAVARLRAEGVPVSLELIGAAYPPALTRLQSKLQLVDPEGRFIRYIGLMPHSELQECYRAADLFVFASSCETFGQILIEAMAAGLPIACSGISAMSELLGEAGVYFKPEDPISITDTLRQLISSPNLRHQCAERANSAAKSYSWAVCADETFDFIQSCMPTKSGN